MAGPTQSDIDLIAQRPVAAGRLLIDGRWHEGEGTPSEVLSPIDGSVLTTLAAASADDVARAVASARASFEAGGWSRMAPAGRKAVLQPDRDTCA
jgi:gamma-glutamyl-gamma-aminobutyraldehyde dehydrogenase